MNSPFQYRGFLGQDNAFSQWVDPRRNALMGFASGMITGNPDAAMRGAMTGMNLDREYATDKLEWEQGQEAKNATVEWLQSKGYDDLVQMAQATGDIGAAWSEGLRRSQPQAPDFTDTQINLAWRAQEAGLQPGTPEYQQFMATGGSGGGGMSFSFDPKTGQMTYSQGMGGKLGQTIDSGLGGQFVQIQQDALTAATGLQTLDAMEQAMSDPSFYSGFGADQLLTAKKAAAAFGINPDGVSSMENFQSLSNKAVLDAMGGSLGTGVSNADRSFIEAQVPRLANSPEGNRQIISIQRALKGRQIEMANLADRYLAAYGNMNGFSSYLAEWAEANPLFPGSGNAGGGSSTGGYTILGVE